MPNWLWFAPLAGLTAVLALGSFRWSGDVADITESDAIMRAAERYFLDASEQGLAGYSGADCVARPGVAPVWIVVTCVNGESRFLYHMDDAGRFVTLKDEGPRT